MTDSVYSEDRVLVGVVRRLRDFDLLRDEHWYRVPIHSAPLCVDADYLAFYLSRPVARRAIHVDAPGGIYYYARRIGFELVRRRDLLPSEPNHPRAMSLYFKLQLEPLETRSPPIGNPTYRTVSFIYTSWERFSAAQVLSDLYQPHEHQEDVAEVL